MASERTEDRIRRLVREEVGIAPSDPAWPRAFVAEKAHLLATLPNDLIRRIEHFGSTAVPGLAAKPIIDILVEVSDLDATRARIVPILEAQGYEYLWRPTHGDDGPPFYAWFIKRDAMTGVRTHHIHMVEASFAEHWRRLLFRDFLIAHPEVAREYEALKRRLAADHPNDRVAYTRGKSTFIESVTERAVTTIMADDGIDALYAAWSDAFCRCDIDAVFALLTPDYVLLTRDAPPISAEALRPRLVAAFAAFEVVPTFEREERIVSGDLAFERGWDVQTLRPRAGGDERTQRQHVALLLQRSADGAWRFARGMVV